MRVEPAGNRQCGRYARLGVEHSVAPEVATFLADPTVIATEVEDPQYFTGQGCPAHRKCRHSDAARALYSTDVASTRGVIAKTAAANDGTIEVTGAFAITAQDNTTTEFADGTTVDKVGRRTGWTRGEVTSTCADLNVFASRITLLCQTIVEDPDDATVVGGGDSGSGVFRVTGSNHVELLGILWGGSRDNKSFAFSPLKNIQDELGAITATQ